MEREALELHDSTLAAIERNGSAIRIRLAPAYVHRSQGEPGRYEGTGWAVNVELIIQEGAFSRAPGELPCDIAAGKVFVGSRALDNLVPLPFTASAAVRVALTLTNAQVVEVSGQALQVQAVGPYEFIEDVPAG